MATGTVISAAPNPMAKARARRSSSGKADPPARFGGRCGALVRDHVVDRIIHSTLRLPAGQLTQSSRVRLTSPELLEALVVRLAVRDQADLRRRVGACDHPLRELVDRDLAVEADVEHLARRGLRA